MFLIPNSVWFIVDIVNIIPINGRNGSGSQIGKIESDDTIRNSNGSSIGKVDKDGTVRNSSGSSIGKVENDGTVRNGNGSSIGKVQGVPKEWAAAYFF